MAPRYVQVKVTILRDLTPFAALIENQSNVRAAQLSDDLFTRWMESSDSIYLNAVPVGWSPRDGGSVDASQRGGRVRGGGF
jgi:hypothetical protein